jgi:hypothetical protein
MSGGGKAGEIRDVKTGRSDAWVDAGRDRDLRWTGSHKLRFSGDVTCVATPKVTPIRKRASPTRLVLSLPPAAPTRRA